MTQLVRVELVRMPPGAWPLHRAPPGATCGL